MAEAQPMTIEIPRNTHIFVATPMYGGMCTGFYAQSILSLQKVGSESGVTLTFSFMFNESLITRARNALVQTFLKTESATHLMFIDADIKFDPMHLMMMIAADKEIICGIYPKKEINWPMVNQAASMGVPVEQWKNHTGSFVVNLVDYQGQVTVPMNQPLEIWNGGTGFMLIKREVFDKLMDKVPSYVNNVVDLGAGLKPEEEIKEFFATSIEEPNRLLLSEDYHFCKVARSHGVKVWAAPWTQLAHVGTYIFEGQLLQSP